MAYSCRKLVQICFLIGLAACLTWSMRAAVAVEPWQGETLTVVVMDPLAGPLACDCVQGYAQRKYERLGAFLQQQLGCTTKVVWSGSLETALKRKTAGRVDLVIGKQSVVVADAAKANVNLVPAARLTGKDGLVTQTGLFVVRSADPALTLFDLKGYRILFGPKDCDEKHAAALARLKQIRIAVRRPLKTCEACSIAASRLLELESDVRAAAVISSYARPLLEGCGTIQRGDLRVIGQTEPVPFITAFVKNSLPKSQRKALVAALLRVGANRELKEALETKLGFVAVARTIRKMKQPAKTTPKSWSGWRGAERDAHVPHLPERLPKEAQFDWQVALPSEGLGGLAATDRYVVLGCRDATDTQDVFICLDAATGLARWRHEYLAPGKLDYGQSARATPLIVGDRVYTLGAFGDLHCLKLESGELIWARNMVQEYGAKQLTWGVCGSPLIADGKLIVQPGAAHASIVALDPATGEEVWKASGRPAGYSSFVYGQFGGKWQLVGYDQTALGGWDPATGKRLWELKPPEDGDFNVGTPVVVGDRLFVATENNGARLYQFDKDGRIDPKPVGQFADLAPDMQTPVAVGSYVFGVYQEMFCLDAARHLKPVWRGGNDAFVEYCSIIASPDRLLLTALEGQLFLIAVESSEMRILDQLSLANERFQVLSHPALVGRHFYVRLGATVRRMTFDGRK